VTFDPNKPFTVVMAGKTTVMCIHLDLVPVDTYPESSPMQSEAVNLFPETFRKPPGYMITRLVGVCRKCGKQFMGELR
jgi:hypothetical protein